MNHNKQDGQATGAKDTVRVRARASIGGEKKRRGAVLLIDALLLIGVVATIFLLILAFTPLDLFGGDTEPRQIYYTLEFVGVEQSAESAFRVGDTVANAETGAEMGVITEVSSRIYEAYTDIPTDQIVPEFDKYVVQKERNEDWRIITVTVRATAEYQSDVGYTIRSQRIAVGREYQLRFPSYTDSGVCVSLTSADKEGEVTN